MAGRVVTFGWSVNGDVLAQQTTISNGRAPKSSRSTLNDRFTNISKQRELSRQKQQDQRQVKLNEKRGVAQPVQPKKQAAAQQQAAPGQEGKKTRRKKKKQAGASAMEVEKAPAPQPAGQQKRKKKRGGQKRAGIKQ